MVHKLITKILQHTPKSIFFADLTKNRYNFDSFTPEDYCCVGCCHFLIYFFLEIFLYSFLERGEEKEKERERNINVGCLLCASYWRPGLQPRHVP